MTDDIMVSISCITYNQEKYISDAIESFLMQKTNFHYEILIHDDASTDRTAEIIREYEKKYPDIIKPVYQIENLHSKGIKVSKFNLIRAHGKYIAICEGDDYWTDPYKLEKQVSYLESNPQCSLCVHGVIMVDKNKKNLNVPIRPSNRNKNFSVEEIIEGGGGLFGTNSMMYPTVFTKNRPAFFDTAPVGDYPLAIYLGLKGIVYYIDEFMSTYRVGSEGSMVKEINQSLDKEKAHFDSIAEMLENINQYSEYKYDKAIKSTILTNRFNILVAQEKYKEIKTGDFRRIYNKLAIHIKLKLLIYQYFPIIKKTFSIIKRHIYKRIILKNN